MEKGETVHGPLLAHGLASVTWPRREIGPWHGAEVRASGTFVAQSPCRVRVCNGRSGPLTGGATLAGRGKIFPSSMRRARGWCWTRWQEEGLTAMELMWTLVGGGDLRVDLRHRVVKSKVRWGPKGKQWRCKQSSPGG
jgi:hypothetical protein